MKYKMFTQKERFLKYLQTCVKSTRATDSNPLFLGGNAPKDYARFLESDRLFDYNPTKWAHIGSMYDINSYSKALEIFNELISDDGFITRDKNDNQGWRRGAISHYVCFLRAQEFFVSSMDSSVQSIKTNVDSLAKTSEEPFSIKKMIGYIEETELLYTSSLVKRFAFSLMS